MTSHDRLGLCGVLINRKIGRELRARTAMTTDTRTPHTIGMMKQNNESARPTRAFYFLVYF